jgi:hypothetical protein
VLSVPAALASLPFLASLLLLMLATSVVGDVIHALLHVSLRQRGILRWPGLLHQSHHDWLDEELAFHDEGFWRNIALHQIPEVMLRLVVATVLSLAFAVDGHVLGALAVVSGFDFAFTVTRRGRDAFHAVRRPVGPPAAGIVVDGAYHALHHAHPEHFLSAHVQVLDRLLGRLLPLRGRRVVVTGGSAFCAQLVDALTGEGAIVARQADDAIDSGAIAAADIVVLGHGASWRDERAYEAILTAALASRSATSSAVLPLDVWAIGDDDAWQARRGAFADRVILRKLRGAQALGAATTLFWLKRGVRDL